MRALVYIAAFAPDAGESVNTLIADPPPGAPVPPILPPQDGFLFLDRGKFHDSFAADIPAELAAFMADSQVPWGVDALGGTISEPAWRSKPSWYLIATEDKMIPPPAQREMSARAGSTVVEVAGSHSIYVSQPKPWLNSSNRLRLRSSWSRTKSSWANVPAVRSVPARTCGDVAVGIGCAQGGEAWSPGDREDGSFRAL